MFVVSNPHIMAFKFCLTLSFRATGYCSEVAQASGKQLKQFADLLNLPFYDDGSDDDPYDAGALLQVYGQRYRIVAEGNWTYVKAVHGAFTGISHLIEIPFQESWDIKN